MVIAVSSLVAKGAPAVASRVASMATAEHALGCAFVDNAHNGLLYIPAFFYGVGLPQGQPPVEITATLRREWMPTYLSCSAFWVPVMWFNFRFLPPHRRVQAMAVCNFFWDVIIDFLAHRGENVRCSDVQ